MRFRNHDFQADAIATHTILETRPSQALGAANRRAAPRGSAAILLIDDDPAVLESLRRVLATGEWDVVTARNGDEALDRLCEQEVDLIITDLRMAGITGWDILFHEALQHPSLPIFVISALSINAVGGADKFATEFFQKPLDMETLLAAVRRHLRHVLDRARPAMAAKIASGA
ncbi:MAG: response regulator [Opitutaceae bacterium]|jgi:DNA-binding NtrC family response regulator